MIWFLFIHHFLYHVSRLFSICLPVGDEDDHYYCNHDATHCSLFGLDFVCEDPTGGALPPCTNGTKVLCSSPPAPPLDDPTPATELHVVTYNIWELRYLYYQNGQRERTCRILMELFNLRTDIDVIVFNEAFMGGCFSRFNATIDMSTMTMRELLEQYGFGYYTTTIGEVREPPKFENGGVFIASRWPITAEDETVYEDSVRLSEDYLAAKGAKYARVVKTVGGESRPYNIFGSHMQASKGEEADNVRVSQATQMRSLMKNLSLPTDEPVIYAGDFNVDYWDGPGSHAYDVLNALNAVVPTVIGELRFTTDGALNDARDGNSESFKDYVVFDAEYLHPENATQEILRPRAPEFFEVCMGAISTTPVYAGSEICRERCNITDLADHFPVIGVYRFEDEMVTTTELGDVKTTTELDDVKTTESVAQRTAACSLAVLLTLLLSIFNSFRQQ